MSYDRRPSDTDRMSSLKVDNLSYRTSQDDLRRAFDKYGDIGDIYIPRDRFTRKSRGFAFVRYYDKRDAEDAMDAMDMQMLDGRELRVQMARYARPPERSRGGRRGGFGGGGGGGGGGYGGGRDRDYQDRDRDRNRRSSRRSRSRSRSRSRGRSRTKSRSRSESSRSRSKSNSKSRSRSR